MPFMQRQITEKQTWLELDGPHGIISIPYPSDQFDVEGTKAELDKETPDLSIFSDAYPGEIWAASVIEGFGCRLSAPGYMDCTEWAVFQTEQECLEYLDETYPEEED